MGCSEAGAQPASISEVQRYVETAHERNIEAGGLVAPLKKRSTGQYFPSQEMAS